MAMVQGYKQCPKHSRRLASHGRPKRTGGKDKKGTCTTQVPFLDQWRSTAGYFIHWSLLALTLDEVESPRTFSKALLPGES